MIRRPVNLPVSFVRHALVVQRVGLGGRMSVERTRRYLDVLGAGLPMPVGTRTAWTSLGGVRTLVVTAPSSDPSRAILYFHGGGYTVGSPGSYRSMAGFLAGSSGATVYLPQYRLGPEHPFPAARDDALAAYRALTERPGSGGRSVVVGGDSAGGGLAVVLARAAMDGGLLAPAALVLASPWVDLTQRSSRKRDRIVSDEWGQINVASYVGAGDAADPGVSPALGRLDGLPPMLIHVGSEEILLPQIEQFAGRLRAAGVAVDLREYGWMWHVAHLQAGLTRLAAEATNELGAYAGAALDAQLT